jgi:hypothetical protein
MHRTKTARAVAVAAAGCVLALPFTVAAQDGESPVIDDDVDQSSWVDISIDQLADSNTGWNEQNVTTTQSNETGQSADSSADGGIGDSLAGESDPESEDPAGMTTATGGAGGSASSANSAGSANAEGGANALTTGNASATNSVSATLSQTQTNSSTNSATSDVAYDVTLPSGGEDMGVADAGGSGSGGTVIESDVDQHAAAEVEVIQTATANSGNNTQNVSNDQSNATGQDSSSSGVGGDAIATGGSGDTTATGGAGGDASSSNGSTSSNSSDGGNTLTTGSASASNSSNVSVTQGSSNTSSNTATSTVTVTISGGG